jgi:predicted Zn-dependent protease with MMP-like domain
MDPEDEGERTREDRLKDAWHALEEGEVESALATARALIDENEADEEAQYLAGSALMEADELREAEPHLRRALEIEPGDLDAHAALAQLLFESCRFDEARTEVGMLLEKDPEDPHAHHLSSLLSERRGEFAAAEEEERMAHRLAPESYPLPTRFTRGEFDAALDAAEGELPETFRTKMPNLAVLVEEIPSDDLLATLDNPSPGILGLFVGTPLPSKSLGDLPAPPDAIYLFKRNLERICESRDELVEEVRITLLHEIGHYMGLDEDQLEASGYD